MRVVVERDSPAHGARESAVLGGTTSAWMEMSSSSVCPLLHEVRRAEHGQTLDLAAVEQLAGNEGGFDGLPDAHVVGDQDADRIELERHQERHELVGRWVDGR